MGTESIISYFENVTRGIKVCGPFVATLNQTPKLECFMARLVVKNGHQKVLL